MRFGVFAVIACSVGCAKIESEFEDPGTPVTVIDEGFQRRVVGPNYEMRFHGGEQNEVHMPESLEIAGDEVLASGARENRLERLVGFGFYPALIATADTNGMVLVGDVTTNDDGPFVGQVSSTFTIAYTCPEPVNTRQFTATSVFTFFPSGRINRFDTAVQAVADDETLSGAAGLACPGAPDTFGAALILTSFWAFLEAGDTVTADPQGNDVTVPPQGVENVPGACTFLGPHSVGVHYKPQSTRVDPNPNADAHVFDFLGDVSSISGSDKFSVISQVQTRAAGDLRCGELLDLLAEPAIRVGSEQVPTQNENGIYDDPFSERSEPYTVQVIGNVAVPPGWVLSTTPSSDTIRITRADGSEPDYNVQRLEVGLNRMLIIFNESLEPGETITIEPL